MNKKLFLSIIGAIALVMTFSSCNHAQKKVEANGNAYNVDTFVVNHYWEGRIKQALARDIAMQNMIFPTDASSFGHKKAEARWRAFDEDMQAIGHVREVGEVTVVHYEHGLEIIKDGQSWFYDDFEYDEDNLTDITAGISILHRSRWEPASISVNSSDLMYRYLCPRNYNAYEEFFIMEPVLYRLNINYKTDVLIKIKEF